MISASQAITVLADLKVLRLISRAEQIQRNISFTRDNTCKQFALRQSSTNLCLNLHRAIRDMKFERLKYGGDEGCQIHQVAKSRGQPEEKLSKHLETIQRTIFFFARSTTLFS